MKKSLRYYSHQERVIIEKCINDPIPFSYEEIGFILKRTPAQVKNHVYYAGGRKGYVSSSLVVGLGNDPSIEERYNEIKSRRQHLELFKISGSFNLNEGNKVERDTILTVDPPLLQKIEQIEDLEKRIKNLEFQLDILISTIGKHQ